MPKVALVDIDGCLVVDGKLNPAVVQQLQEGGYDEIILFTQRSKYLQVAQISRAYLLGKPPVPGAIVTTLDAVAALEQALRKPIRVSTSVDQFFGRPTEYYGADGGLAQFESEIKKESFAKRDDFNSTRFNEEVTAEAKHIRERLKNDPKLGEDPSLDVNTPDTSALYPKGKVKQYMHLLEGLPTILEVDNLNDTTIDFLDDRGGNLNEVFYGADVIKPPTRLMVVGDTIFTNIELGEVAAPALEKAKRITETIQGDSENIGKLTSIKRSFDSFELPEGDDKQQVALTIFTNYLVKQGVIEKPTQLTKESVYQACVSKLVANQLTQWNQTNDNTPLIEFALESLPLSIVNQLIDDAPIKKVQKNQIRHEVLDCQLNNLGKLHQDQSKFLNDSPQLQDNDKTEQTAMEIIGGIKDVIMSTQWNTGLGGEKVKDPETGQTHRVPKHMAEILKLCNETLDHEWNAVSVIRSIESIASDAADKKSWFRDNKTQQAYRFFQQKKPERVSGAGVEDDTQTVKRYSGLGNPSRGSS